MPTLILVYSGAVVTNVTFFSQTQTEYKKPGKEINDSCRAFQQILANDHPQVKQAEKAYKQASDVSTILFAFTRSELWRASSLRVSCRAERVH